MPGTTGSTFKRVGGLTVTQTGVTKVTKTTADELIQVRVTKRFGKPKKSIIMKVSKGQHGGASASAGA